MALRIIIKVSPASSRSMCQIDKNGNLKCYLKSTPENGKANDELIRLIGQKLAITKNDISIVLGKTARNKTLIINTALSEEAVRSLLCNETQLKIE